MSFKTRREFLSLTVALTATSLSARSSATPLLFPVTQARQAASSPADGQGPVAKPFLNSAFDAAGTPSSSTQPASLSPPLSWERDHPARLAWSTHLLREVTKVMPQLASARDIEDFYPNYSMVDDAMKAMMWAELIVLIAFFESAWEPCARYHETGLGNDTVTHLPVYSEGLLQLSYQDMDVYPNLPFNWEKDKSLSPTDCAKTILDPLNNLSAGVEILATQIQTYQKIVLKNHNYWSTLQDPAIGKHSRVERIKSIATRWASSATTPSSN